jgi:hypothetical protein
MRLYLQQSHLAETNLEGVRLKIDLILPSSALFLENFRRHVKVTF